MAMAWMDNVDNEIETDTISIVNKYDPLVRHIETLTDTDIGEIYEYGYLSESDIDRDTLIFGLQYFLTIISEEAGYLTFEYKKAIMNYQTSAYLDKEVDETVGKAINQGTIRCLFNISTFKRKRELEREVEKVEIMNSMIYELTDMGGDKDQLALLKTMVSIAKDNENKLRDTRDFVILHIPEEEFVDSYLLLLNILNDIVPEYARMNSVNAESIKGKIRSDEFIKKEDVLNVEFLDNLNK